MGAKPDPIPLHTQLAILLEEAGWRGTGDTPTLALRELLPKIQALIVPTPGPAGGPAYPVDHQVAHTLAVVATKDMPEGPMKELAYLHAVGALGAGMGLRDYFAGQALQGWLASMAPDSEPDEYASSIAKQCFTLADAMLEARGQ